MPISLRPALLTLAALTAFPAAAFASPARYVPGEVVVRYESGDERVRRVPAGSTVAREIRRLRARPDVVWAVANHIARVSQFVPNDPGPAGVPGGWSQTQWNFAGEFGVKAPQAWANLIAAGRPGGAGVTIAVLDTGVAYSNRGRFRRSPDLSQRAFRAGYDFVDGDDRPYDENGHGTHVASTIGEAVNNGIALTGLAYGARIIPVRVLDNRGEGDAATIARGIRFAAKRKAQIINLSLEFSASVSASQIPEIISALRYATRQGSLVVGASGNEARRVVAYPARNANVMSVGAVTAHGCQADYSNEGRGLDVVAPGGGADASLRDDPQHCRPLEEPGPPIYQYTFDGSVRRFGYPEGYEGTSMAAPHVSATAALVIASGVLGPKPSPLAVERHLERTATDLGPQGYDTRYGHGLIDAANATTRTPA